MNTSRFTIRYKAVHPGTDCTELFFYGSIEQALQNAGNMKQNAAASTAQGATSLKQRRLYITDEQVASLSPVKSFLQKQKEGGAPVCIVKAGEEHKSIDSVLKIVKTALDNNLNRSSIFVGIGGGVVCDMSAFAASVFKRGALLELIPTTLLAMVDAAIGGKTGCDFGDYKNMIGSFYPAGKLHIAPEFTQSLSDTEFRSGLAEVLKTALLYDKKLFRLLQEKKEEVLRREAEIINHIVRVCTCAKARTVQKDLTERGIRMHLNLGHTFGHALETLAGLGTISHGEAVAWGIGRAIALSEKLELCPSSYKEEVFQALQNYGWSCERVHPVLHTALKKARQAAPLAKDSPTTTTDGSAGTAADSPTEALLQAMKKDKKNSSNTVRLILQKGIESAVIREVEDEYIRTVL
ncbi:MAG: 3-dehydroquinate synthase [Treponema sp.]|uniref:3-dehydroquinate synthase n=1 Tax=Treponema sp. TaxID=166 RepID=UPI003FA2A5CE